MPLKSLKALNVMLFKRKNTGALLQEINEVGFLQQNNNFSDALKMQFSGGVNLIIGENGLGKTTILKMLYAACEWSNELTTPTKTKQFGDFFSSNLENTHILKSFGNEKDYSAFEVRNENSQFVYSLTHSGFFGLDNWIKQQIKAVFIPTTEMLSHSKGFLAMDKKYKMPFDGTQVDIIVNAELPETREVSPENQNLLDKLSVIIGGAVAYENDTFYIQKNSGQKIEFALEAEGLRKIALLWKLIRNGLLEKDSVLFWDEPEANLNPQILPVVVDVLLALQQAGVQIFVATHSDNLMQILNLKKKSEHNVRFFSLYKQDDMVKVESDENLNALQNNAVLKANVDLYDKYIDKQMEGLK